VNGTGSSPSGDAAPAGPGRRSGSILGGASVLVAGRYAVAVLAWIGTAIVIRELTRVEWGQYSYVFGLLGIVGLVADLRLSRIVLRDVMHAGAEVSGRVVGSYVALRLVIGVVSYLVALAWVLIGGQPAPVVAATAVAGLNLITLSAAWGVILLFEARLYLRDVSVAQVAGQVVQFLGVVALAASSLASILWFAWAAVLNAVVVLAWLLVAARRHTRLRLHVDLHRWGIWVREAAPLALGAALDTVYFRIDIVMLAALDSFRAVGSYNVGYKFSDLLGAVPLAVATPALTMLVACWPDDPEGFRRTFRQASVILAVGAVGAGVGFSLFAEPLVVTLYGARYRDAADAARLLVAGQALHFFTLLCFSTLVAAGRHRLYPAAMLVGVGLNVGLNAAWIPRWSYLGSAWATVLTEVVVLGVLAAGVARVPGVRPWPARPLLVCGGAGAVMAAVALALRPVLPWPAAAAVAGGAYLATCHLARVDGPGGLRALAAAPARGLGVLEDPAD
jgi:O-antigen/teichoic acid export membrane protein